MGRAGRTPVARVYVEREVMEQDSSVVGTGPATLPPFQVSGDSTKEHVGEEAFGLQNVQRDTGLIAEYDSCGEQLCQQESVLPNYREMLYQLLRRDKQLTALAGVDRNEFQYLRRGEGERSREEGEGHLPYRGHVPLVRQLHQAPVEHQGAGVVREAERGGGLSPLCASSLCQ